MDIPINIPVKRHLYKFLIAFWGNNYRLSTKDFLGCFIYHLLKKQENCNPVHDDYNPDSFPERFTVWISDNFFFNRTVNDVKPKSIQQFNTCIDSLFDFLFINQTELRIMLTKMEKKDAYDLFMDDIGLDEFDLTSDALKQSHYRHKKKKIKNKSFH